MALLGPRQVGKTTLALEIADAEDAVYLDLESPADRARLIDPELYLADYEDRLVILDEVHRLPDLFQSLRGLIDRGRRRGKRARRFLLLGSASVDLLRQSGETLAGRIAYLDLGPFDVLEVGGTDLDAFWVRGGFPDSFLAADDDRSLTWRENFIRTYLERDVPQFGPRIPAETLRRFWGDAGPYPGRIAQRGSSRAWPRRGQQDRHPDTSTSWSTSCWCAALRRGAEMSVSAW